MTRMACKNPSGILATQYNPFMEFETRNGGKTLIDPLWNIINSKILCPWLFIFK
jgi:hypothetical protein